MSIARVALDCPIDSLFDYRIKGQLELGQLLVVPFGRRRQVGLLVALAQQSEIATGRLRDIESVLPVEPLPAEILGLIRFCSDYYHYPIGQTAFAALPSALRRVGYQGPRPRWQYVLTAAGRALDPDFLPARAGLKRRLLEVFQAQSILRLSELRDLSVRAQAIADEWVSKGWLERRPDTANITQAPSFISHPQHHLTNEQGAAVNAVSAAFGSYSPWLLEGVTGSGKTEVYFRLIEQAALRGLQTLLMVPEINLTPQLEHRFRERFAGLHMVALHSNLAEGERCANWLSALAGKAQVVIGTRLAVFTPLPRLGLIIVDEEQDSSFKQQDGLRYSARDLAVVRARQRRVPVVLGSATPSLESFQNARTHRFGHLQLSRRPVASRAVIRLIDICDLPPTQALSESVLAAIEAREKRGEQSLVFLNRRGFAPAMVCRSCGWSADCPRCNARLVWHLAGCVLRCHYCGHEEQIPNACPACGDQDMKGIGHGTQRLEQFLGKRFAQARILRIDRDSTRGRYAWDEMQGAIRQGRAQLLVGTQMLAKGHDFPNLTLVAVVNPDSALFSADFRAGEKLFQQLMQVAGRAGRAELPGEVLVQTQFPAHPLYQALLRQDYRGFAEELLDQRKRALFPPFIYQALLRAESLNESSLTNFLSLAARAAAGVRGEVTLYDPVPATIAKIAGHHRAHLLAQCSSRSRLQRFLSVWRRLLSAQDTKRVRWCIDVDPLEL